MFQDNLARLCAIGLLGALLVVPSVSTGQAPPLDIPSIELTAGLSPKSIEKINAALKYHVETIRKAEKQKDILEGCESLLGVYNSYDNPIFKYTVADRATEIVVTLLESDNQQKQINAAIVLSRMPQFSIQDTLERMVVHSNPAVRYLGWKGYRGARGRILAQRSSAATEKMFKALRKAGAEEASSVVVRGVFDVMFFATVPPDAVSGSDFDNARRESLDVLRSCWARRCKQALDGDTQIAEALRSGVGGITNAWVVLGSDKQLHTTFLQMIVDAAGASGTAYYSAMRTAAGAEGLAKDDATRKIAVNTLLLRDCELALNSIKGLNKKYIERPLIDKKIPDRASAPLGYKDVATGEQFGVLGWVGELKDDGVRKPQMLVPVVTTAPAPPEEPNE